MLQWLISLDTRLFLFFNGKHNPFWDFVMYWASDQFIWIPLYALLAYAIWRRERKAAILYFAVVVVLIVASDQLSSHFIKEWVRRPRPSHEAALSGLVHLSKAGPGGEYGFVSSHASNSFALALFLSLTLPAAWRQVKWVLLGWACLVAYSRIYNGVHYPGDVLCGALLGCMLAVIGSWLFRRAETEVKNKRRRKILRRPARRAPYDQADL
jgi:undecaprenyl-diphosphatase